MTETVLLGELLTDLAMGPFGSNLKADNFIDSGVPVVKGGNLYGYEVGGDFSYVSEEKAQLLKRSLAHPDDIVITHRGTLGQISIVPHGKYPYYLVSQSQLRLTPNKEKVDPRYLLYYLRSSLGQHELMQHAAQVGVPSIATPTKAVKSFRVLLPDLETQKRIASILGTIDEKIELNRKMNETLEQMGQALFRHYFIDNPEAEKWEEGTLGDIIINFDSKRKPLSSRQRAEMRGSYRYFGATSVMDHVNAYLFDGKYLLLAEDGSVIKADGTPYLQYIWGQFWVNNHAHILQAKNPFTVEYLYLLLSRANVQSLVSGAVQLKINQKAMNGFRVKLPPAELVSEFCEIIKPLFAQRRTNEEQIQTLTTLRDTLLPRLINGKIKV